MFEKPTTRMFMQALGIQVTAAIGLFTGKVDPATWAGTNFLVMSIYGVASYKDKQVLTPSARDLKQGG